MVHLEEVEHVLNDAETDIARIPFTDTVLPIICVGSIAIDSVLLGNRGGGVPRRGGARVSYRGWLRSTMIAFTVFVVVPGFAEDAWPSPGSTGKCPATMPMRCPDGGCAIAAADCMTGGMPGGGGGTVPGTGPRPAYEGKADALVGMLKKAGAQGKEPDIAKVREFLDAGIDIRQNVRPTCVDAVVVQY